jgi:hypothetical protein
MCFRAEVRQARTVADISSPVGVVRTNKIDKQLQTKQKITPKVSNSRVIGDQPCSARVIFWTAGSGPAWIRMQITRRSGLAWIRIQITDGSGSPLIRIQITRDSVLQLSAFKLPMDPDLYRSAFKSTVDPV